MATTFDRLQKPPPDDDKKGWERWYYRVCELLNGEWWKGPFKVGTLPVYPDQTGVDYTEFEADGTMVAHGAAKTYDDVYPSSVTVGVGGTAPNFTAYNGGNLKAYEFTGGVSNKEMQIGYQIYHSYAEGTSVVPHVHITFTSGAASAGQTIIFDLEYEWSNADDTGAYGTTTVRGTHTIAANNTVYKNEIVSFGDVVGTGKLISSIFMTRLVRMQSVDTFTGSCWLMSADIHINKNTVGSREPFTK